MTNNNLKNQASGGYFNGFKNPFIWVAFFLIILFFAPFSSEYSAIKITIAIMIIAYGLSLGAFKKKSVDAKILKLTKSQKKELENEIEQIKHN